MRTIQFAAFCHFLADMFDIIGKLSLKMQRNDLILPIAVSLLCETVTNVESLKTRPVPNGHLKRFMDMLEESGVDNELQFQGNTLKGCLDGTPKRGGVRTGNFQSITEEAIGLCQAGLKERFGSLLIGTISIVQASTYSTTDVIKDMLVCNVNAWPTSAKALVDFGNNKIERLTNWFKEPVSTMMLRARMLLFMSGA